MHFLQSHIASPKQQKLSTISRDWISNAMPIFSYIRLLISTRLRHLNLLSSLSLPVIPLYPLHLYSYITTSLHHYTQYLQNWQKLKRTILTIYSYSSKFSPSNYFTYTDLNTLKNGKLFS